MMMREGLSALLTPIFSETSATPLMMVALSPEPIRYPSLGAFPVAFAGEGLCLMMNRPQKGHE